MASDILGRGTVEILRRARYPAMVIKTIHAFITDPAVLAVLVHLQDWDRSFRTRTWKKNPMYRLFIEVNEN